MAKCKVCHRDITRYYNDICPYCGAENPIDSNYKTKDMTQVLDPVTGEVLYKSKSKKLACFLQLFLGWLGLADFYLGFVKKGLMKLISTIVAVGGIGSILFFLLPKGEGFTLNGNIFSYILVLIVIFLIHAGLSITYFNNDSLKDATGEFTH